MKLSTFLLVSGVVTGLLLLGRNLFSARPVSRYSGKDEPSLDDYHIRELAQQIWESEGRPEGQATRHWTMATELLKSDLADKNYLKKVTSETSQPPYTHTDKKNFH